MFCNQILIESRIAATSQFAYFLSCALNHILLPINLLLISSYEFCLDTSMKMLFKINIIAHTKWVSLASSSLDYSKYLLTMIFKKKTADTSAHGILQMRGKELMQVVTKQYCSND